MLEKHNQTAISHDGVLGQKKTDFFFFLCIQRMGGSYIMPEKHDRIAE